MDEHEGDLGGLSARRMEERAIRERWPMPEAVRVKILKRLCKICDEDAWEGDFRAPGHREVIAAARALISADKLNLEQAKFDHQTRPAEQVDDDYEIDLGAPGDPPHDPDGAPA